MIETERQFLETKGMDSLFRRDTMQTRTILDMVCGYLSWEDLRELKDVSCLSGEVVKEHRYFGLVTLCEPHRLNQSTLTEGSIGTDHGGGPILPNLCIDTLIESK